MILIYFRTYQDVLNIGRFLNNLRFVDDTVFVVKYNVESLELLEKHDLHKKDSWLIRNLCSKQMQVSTSKSKECVFLNECI